MNVIKADARTQQCITEAQAQFFLDTGFLVVEGVLDGEELKTVQQAMDAEVEIGIAGKMDHPDYMYGKGGKSGKDVLRRIEYVIDKRDPMKSLLGHPFILRSVERLQGRNFIPTWDAMVLKMPDEGIVVQWHRDGATIDYNDLRPIFNVDFYLDEADLKSCLWVIPGSNHWTAEEAAVRCRREGFDTADAIPVPMKPGDVIFHDIKVLHGSPAGDGNALRRTVYYEFRPGELEYAQGPHTKEYLKLKQQVLLECLQRRQGERYALNEQPYEYRPDGWFAIEAVTPPDSYRYAHRDYWRK